MQPVDIICVPNILELLLNFLTTKESFLLSRANSNYGILY